MKLLIPVTLLLGFLWLARESMADDGYDPAEVTRLNDIAAPCHPIADIWQLCGEDVAKPVVLFQ